MCGCPFRFHFIGRAYANFIGASARWTIRYWSPLLEPRLEGYCPTNFEANGGPYQHPQSVPIRQGGPGEPVGPHTNPLLGSFPAPGPYPGQ